jgi:hypothetical protein
MLVHLDLYLYVPSQFYIPGVIQRWRLQNLKPSGTGGDEEEEEDIPERISSDDAWIFPIVSRAVHFVVLTMSNQLARRLGHLRFLDCIS